MQAAFVDIGLDKAAFLHASDIVTAGLNIADAELKAGPVKDIRLLVHEGQFLLVQVVKDPLGTKGARLTTDITLPSRHLVFMPGSAHVGVSQRIESEAERQRLKDIVSTCLDESGGYIVRTAAEGAGEDELLHDGKFLQKLWAKVLKRKKNARKETMLYEELTLAYRILRDFVGSDLERVRIDSKLTYQQLHAFTEEFVPEMTSRLEYYPGERPVFDLFDVENEIQRALERRVMLKSGGYLMIDQTEAMTTIDVNTGSFVGGRSLEDTVYKTNLEATHAIARQLRLRNLGGIIILDFIDMQEQQHRDEVLASLQDQLKRDYAKTNISEVSALGLIEMTRKRTRESLQQQLCEPCPTCGGKGFVKSAETVCLEIFRELMRCARTYNAPKKFTVVANSGVIDLLETIEADTVAEMEYLLGRPINLESDNRFNQEQYDILLD